MSSYYEALPIYRVAMGMVVRIDRAVQRFPKGQKYVLGARLRDGSLDVVLLIARANCRAERSRWLPVLCDRIEEIKLGRITRRFAALKSAPCLSAQAARLSRGITVAGASRPAVLLVQVGRWAEAHREGRRLGLRLRKLKRRLRVARRGWLPRGSSSVLLHKAAPSPSRLKSRRAQATSSSADLRNLFEPISPPTTAGETVL